MRSLLGVALGLLFTAAACGSADEHPLGGPYGGSSSATKPGAGTTGGSTNAASGGDTTGASSSSGDTTGTSGGSSTSSTGGSSTSSSGGSSTSSTGGTSGGSSTSSSGSSGTSGGSSGTSGGSSSGGPAAPTWTQLHTLYLKSGTIGNCPHCHSSTSSASSAFTWIKGKGYSPAALVDKNQSCLSWFGGNMPSSGVTSAAAAKDFNAWFAAGGLNN
jgi:hypothetical protein